MKKLLCEVLLAWQFTVYAHGAATIPEFDFSDGFVKAVINPAHAPVKEITFGNADWDERRCNQIKTQVWERLVSLGYVNDGGFSGTRCEAK